MHNDHDIIEAGLFHQIGHQLIVLFSGQRQVSW